MKRKFILLHSAGYKTEEVFEKRVAHRGLKLIEMIHYSFNCKLPIYHTNFVWIENRVESVVFHEKPSTKNCVERFLRIRRRPVWFFGSWMVFVETILSLPRSRTLEHNAVKWFALECQVSSVFRPDAGPALPRMRSLRRMDALASRSTISFRQTSIEFLPSFFSSSSFSTTLFSFSRTRPILIETSDWKDHDKLDSGFRYFCSFGRRLLSS